MTDARRQGLLLSVIFFLHTVTLLSAKHHHHKGQQCRTAWSSIQAHFTFNLTTPVFTSNLTHNATGTSADTTKQHVAIIGVPWQYEGKPILSTFEPPKQLVTVAPSNSTTISTNQTGQTTQPRVDQVGFPCIDSGVLFSCSKCDDFLTGHDCYKKIGPEELSNDSSGTVKCDLWYTRSGFGEGGGVTMCGTKSGEVFQCSSDKGLSECNPCVELGNTSA